MPIRLWIPLLLFLVPTLLIGFGVVIPASCIAGFNELTIGFLGTVVGSALTYVCGVRTALGSSRGEER